MVNKFDYHSIQVFNGRVKQAKVKIVIDDLNDYSKALQNKGVLVNVAENLIHPFYSE